MGFYEWRGNGEFLDNRNNRTIEPGEVVELDERVVGNHDFVEVDEPPGDADETESEASGSTPVEDKREAYELTAGERYPREVLEDADWQQLRDMAAEVDSETVNGRSSKEDIVDFFAED